MITNPAIFMLFHQKSHIFEQHIKHAFLTKIKTLLDPKNPTLLDINEELLQCLLDELFSKKNTRISEPFGSKMIDIGLKELRMYDSILGHC